MKKLKAGFKKFASESLSKKGKIPPGQAQERRMAHDLYTLKTKPISMERLGTHTEKDVEEWLKEYREAIHKPKNIINMGESGVRVGVQQVRK
jgi:hypothetical protein